MSRRVGTVLLVDADPATARWPGRPDPRGVSRPGRRGRTPALAILGGERVDVLVSELVLPEQSGLHLLVEARRLHPAVLRVALTR